MQSPTCLYCGALLAQGRDVRLPDLLACSCNKGKFARVRVHAAASLVQTARGSTLLDFLGAYTGRKLPRGKTAHVAEVLRVLPDGGLRAVGTKVHPSSRVKGCPSLVYSRLYHGALDKLALPLRVVCGIGILDGAGHRTIRRRNDSLAAKVAQGEAITDPPIGVKKRRRGDVSSEATVLYAEVLLALTASREWRSVVSGDRLGQPRSLEHYVFDKHGAPFPGATVEIEDLDSKQKFTRQTDERARAVFEDLPGERYGLLVRYPKEASKGIRSKFRDFDGRAVEVICTDGNPARPGPVPLYAWDDPRWSPESRQKRKEPWASLWGHLRGKGARTPEREERVAKWIAETCELPGERRDWLCVAALAGLRRRPTYGTAERLAGAIVQEFLGKKSERTIRNARRKHGSA